MNKVLKIGAFSLFLTITGMGFGTTAHAADYSNSNMMDDQIFDNVGSMNESQIQSFLASKGPCLANYSDVEPSWNGSSWSYTGSIPASRIIYKAAQQWGLNPQVIIATLQKEESLITGTSCDGWRYNSAMGYGCPDSGGCNAKYVGFTRQVLWGSWQLKFNKERSYGNTAWDGDDGIVYVGYMTQGARKRCGTCSIVNYDGNATIDGQSIHLDNGTTASLYTYTPHLNQSFPGIFESWFGSVRGVTYAWSYAGQSSNKLLNGIRSGQTATFTVSAVNSGFYTWYNSGSNPVRLGTSHPNDRSSAFATTGWLSSARPATLNEASVAPGQTGTFTFNVKMPAAGGRYNEYFNLMVEGSMWMNDPGLYFDITVIPDTYTWNPSSQAAYTNSSKTTSVDITNLSPGQTAWLVVRGTNTGNVPWSNTGPNPVRVGTEGPKERKSRYATPSWLSPSRPGTLVEASVAPGATGTFEFPITIPPGNGSFVERFNLLAEGLTWMNDPGFGYSTRVNGNYSWSLTDQYAFTDSTKTTSANSGNLLPGQTIFIGFKARNTGNATWFQGGAYPVRVGTSHPLERVSSFAAPDWLWNKRPVGLVEASVPPGGIGTFEFSYKAPAQVGVYDEYFTPVAEGIVWMNDIGLYFHTAVGHTYTWNPSSQAAYTNSSKTTSVDITNLSPGQTAWLVVRGTNTGNVPWSNTGPNPVRVGTEGPKERKSRYATPSWLSPSRPGTLVEASVAPGATGTFEFPITIPPGNGSFVERFNLLAEGLTWMNDPGFGYSTRVNGNYSWSLTDQYAFTDSTKTTSANSGNLLPGQTIFIGFKARNTGNATWFQGGAYPVRVGTSHPLERVSSFAAPDWLWNKRPVGLVEASVPPGGIGTFEFSYKAPAQVGVYDEYFTPVAEGIVWMNDIGLYFHTAVQP